MTDDKPRGAGKSSFDLLDQHLLLQTLDLAVGSVVLDAGSGRGNYALAVAGMIGPKGKVYAFDAWPEGIAELRERALERGLQNIEAEVVDLRSGIPLADKSVDICLMATVLHDLIRDGLGERALNESARVLRPQGRFAVVEFKKMAGPPGPPIDIRLSPDELEAFIGPFGFRKHLTKDVGPYNYLLLATLHGPGEA